MIFDTDVLIWYFRGNHKAKEALARVPFKERRISALCVMELVQGSRDAQELRMIKGFLRENISAIIPPGERISEKAISLLEEHARPDGLRTIDALIAATAIHEADTLVTANYKHYKKISSLDVRRFEP